jgi:hypothetical protein
VFFEKSPTFVKGRQAVIVLDSVPNCVALQIQLLVDVLLSFTKQWIVKAGVYSLLKEIYQFFRDA